MKLLIQVLPIALIFIGSCGVEPTIKEVNPASAGFNDVESDQRAVEIADEVMDAMGGRGAWDSTRYIKWNFFGRRTLTWDKHDQLCRIEIPGEQLEMVVNLNNKTGQASQGGALVSHPDSLAKLIQRGYEIWINDSYWLVMPFKLKDSGVTLKYLGRDTTLDGTTADLLELTFADVGVTPDNRYVVYVDDASRLVSQWDFYTTYTDSLPRFAIPWHDYEKKGRIVLSGNRGRVALTDIEVFDHLDESVFTSLKGVNSNSQ